MLKFEVSEQYLAIIAKALGAQSYDLVAPVIMELQRQLIAQRQPAEVKPSED